MSYSYEYGIGEVSSQRDQIARFFFTRKLHLPEADSEALDPNLDYQDVKLKIVQLEGYDAHDFNLFDDRSSQLWRKPYVDGAVRELTSGDSRSQDQIRQAVERLMLAAGNYNPDVRHTSRPAHRSRANVTLDVEIDDEDQVPPRPQHIKSLARGRGRAASPDQPSLNTSRRPLRHRLTCLSGLVRSQSSRGTRKTERTGTGYELVESAWLFCKGLNSGLDRS